MNMWHQGQLSLSQGEAIILVTITSVEGSSPREVGATMLVTPRGFSGTIGGGTMEWQAMAKAQAMLNHENDFEQLRFNLGPDLGQCCGGRVALSLQRFTPNIAQNFILCRDQNQSQQRQLFLFGAGHVGRALVLILAQSPFEVIWCDQRPNAFPAAMPSNVTLRADASPESILAEARSGAMVMIMSHSHALDLVLVDAALRHPNIVETGLIGSATKRARFESRLRAANVAEHRIAQLHCPIGIGAIRSKLPHAIAISTAAQLITLDEKHIAVEGMVENNNLGHVNL